MAKRFPHLTDAHRDFIARQHIFFTASATEGARVNLSPKPADDFRVLGDNAVAYLDRTGSGNETAAHLLADGRLTIMFCAFEGAPLILRLYGQGRVLHRDTGEYKALLTDAFSEEPLGARQIVLLDVDLVQTSCGFGVPLFDYHGERHNLDRWAEAKGEEGLVAYRLEKNARSMDGLPTGLFSEETAEVDLPG
jgi:predicted pyridoxine 5'-phosphate oxidase superfamily flavin-nucleotide-binding protein